MEFSVVIVTYNSYSVVRDCLIHLKESAKHFGESKVSITVVDNGSTDQTRDWLETQDVVKVNAIFNENSGFGSGVNLGARGSGGDVILVLNPDVRIAPDFFCELEGLLLKNEDVGIIAPKLLNTDGTTQLSYRRIPSVFSLVSNRLPPLGKWGRIFDNHWQRYMCTDKDPTVPFDIPFALGACLAIRREVYEQVNGFDDSYFLYFEDCQLCRDVWDIGWRVRYEPSLVAEHNHMRESTNIFSASFKHHLRSAITFYSRNKKIWYRLPQDPYLGIWRRTS